VPDQFHLTFSLLHPLIPGVFGDALGNQEHWLFARPQLQHGVLTHRPAALGTGDLHRSFENLQQEKTFFQVQPKPRLAVGCERGAACRDLVEVVVFGDEVERRVTLMKRQAIDLAAARRQEQLRKLQQ
jgi:hypothetical protein